MGAENGAGGRALDRHLRDAEGERPDRNRGNRSEGRRGQWNRYEAGGNRGRDQRAGDASDGVANQSVESGRVVDRPQAPREQTDRRRVTDGAVDKRQRTDSEGDDVGCNLHDALELARPVEIALRAPGRADPGERRGQAEAAPGRGPPPPPRQPPPAPPPAPPGPPD